MIPPRPFSGMIGILLGSALVPILAWTSLPAQAESISVPIKTRVIEHFMVGSDASRFGKLIFAGGLEFSSSTGALGGMSAIRLSADRTAFIGVMDTGHWYAGRILRDPAGRPAGLDNFSVAPILSASGEESDKKWQFDAEGLALRGDEAIVSFERVHRVEIYSAREPAASKPAGSLPLPIPLRELRGNRGLETVAVSPDATGLAGAVVAVSERSLNKAGDLFAAILEGPSQGVFFVRRHAPYDVTDGDFLPDGDLVLLERRFSIAEGVGMRIRRIKGGDIRPGATVDGEILLDADYGYQIDNMEGLDVSVDENGQVHLTLVSDDNHSILQRNLLLEFRLDETGE